MPRRLLGASWRCCKFDTAPRQPSPFEPVAVASLLVLNLSKGAVRQSHSCRSTSAAPCARLVKGMISMKFNFRQRLLTSTLLAGAGLLANPAYAQNAPGTSKDTQAKVPDQNTATNSAAAQPTGGPVGPIPTRNAQSAPVQSANDIIITGTRIPQPNLTSAAPITVVTNQ